MNEAISRIVAEMRENIRVLRKMRDDVAGLIADYNRPRFEQRDLLEQQAALHAAIDAMQSRQAALRAEAIAQQPSNAARGGCVMVPVIPTEAMIKAGYDAMNKHVAIGILPGDVYAAMIATLGELQ
jgi:hypothetical protein